MLLDAQPVQPIICKCCTLLRMVCFILRRVCCPFLITWPTFVWVCVEVGSIVRPRKRAGVVIW